MTDYAIHITPNAASLYDTIILFCLPGEQDDRYKVIRFLLCQPIYYASLFHIRIYISNCFLGFGWRSSLLHGAKRTYSQCYNTELCQPYSLGQYRPGGRSEIPAAVIPGPLFLADEKFNGEDFFLRSSHSLS
jgi:hypothetical protein